MPPTLIPLLWLQNENRTLPKPYRALIVEGPQVPLPPLVRGGSSSGPQISIAIATTTPRACVKPVHLFPIHQVASPVHHASSCEVHVALLVELLGSSLVSSHRDLVEQPL